MAPSRWTWPCSCQRPRGRALRPLLRYLMRPWTASQLLRLETPAGRLWIALSAGATFEELREAVREATGVDVSAQKLAISCNDEELETLHGPADAKLSDLGLEPGARVNLLNVDVRLPPGLLSKLFGRAAEVFPKADIVIRGGTIVDGTGSPAFEGDIAIDGAIITAVGPALAVRGSFEVDASGLLVTPGWVDVHTHFDGQVTWDPYLTPSGLCGVTTCVMGSCGIGFAPCRKRHRKLLVRLVESVEDIPGTALHEGITWEWETFEEYMDLLESRQLVCDVGVLIGHAPLRTWVMGHRANLSDRPGGPKDNPVQPQEIEMMAEIVKDAVAAGALGFSTSRILLHRDSSGILTPGSLASADEMRAIGDALASGGGGVLQLAQDFATYDDFGRTYTDMDFKKKLKHDEAEWEWMLKLALKHAKKVTLSYVVTTTGGEDSDLPLARLGHLNYKGGLARAQVLERPQALLMSFDSAIHPFMSSSTFKSIPAKDRLSCLQEGGSLRSQVLAEASRTKSRLDKILNDGWKHVYPWTPGYEPPPELSIHVEATQRGVSPLEVALDKMLADDGLGVLWSPMFQYAKGSLQATWRALMHPYSVPGGADAGAHCTVIQDATSATHMLTHWTRDRTRGPLIPLETAVKKQTSETATLFGLSDRGVLAAGKRADLNVIDLKNLEILAPYYAYDLPAGAGRWLQKVKGYRLTMVAGKVTVQEGKPTGQLPGRLVRNPRAERSAWRGAARAMADPNCDGEDREMKPIHPSHKAAEDPAALGLSALGRALRNNTESQEGEDSESEDLEPALEPIKGKSMCETGCAVS